MPVNGKSTPQKSNESIPTMTPCLKGPVTGFPTHDFWGPPAVSELGFHELGISHPWFMPGFFRWRCRVVRQLLACGFWGFDKEDWLREKEGFFLQAC